jgi:uncharacterized membrane protein YfhO
MVYDWETIKDDKLIIERLLDSDFPINKKVIVEDFVDYEKISEGVYYQLEYNIYEEQKSRIKVNTEKDGLLFVSDAWYPDWKAYLDSTEVKIYRANYAFRAVKIPKGDHLVEFAYEPESFKKGIYVSFTSVLVLLGIYAILKKSNWQNKG